MFGPYGHFPLVYGQLGQGLYAQLWGMALASLALPAWVLVIVTALLALGESSMAQIPRRAIRFVVVSIAAAVLCSGFIGPFQANLPAVNENSLDFPEKLRSIGALAASPAEPVALGVEDSDAGATTLLSWLRCQGIHTMGRPIHHYSHDNDFALYWTAWIDGRIEARTRPLAPEDLTAAGVAKLIVPHGQTVATNGDPRWQRATPADGAGRWEILRTSATSGDVALVRSDLLLRSGGPDLEEAAIA